MNGYRSRPRWDVAEVLARTDLSVLLDHFTQPSSRSGPGRKWHCPVDEHDDHRASVSMFRDRHGHERWKCWSSDHRGDAIDLVMLRTDQDRTEAIDWLANQAGMIRDQPLPPIRARTPTSGPALTMDPAVERYVSLCESVLRGPQGRPVRDWLHDRGLSGETIRANRIGADPGRELMRRRRGLPYGAQVAATFPAFDPVGNLTYVQARYLDPDTAGRKYDNPAAALAPHPRISFPTPGGERGGILLVCEGIPDALIATQAGYSAVALLGAQTPDDAVAMRIAYHASDRDLGVAIVADPDPAGRHLATVLGSRLTDHGIDPTTVTTPDGLDLNAWSLTDPDWHHHLDTQLGTDPAGVEFESSDRSIGGPEL